VRQPRERGNRLNERTTWLLRALLGLALVTAWEAAGAFSGATWTSKPSLIAARLVQWGERDLAWHIAITLQEIVAGLAIGVPLGIVLGVLLGRAPMVAKISRPLILILNSIPVVALAPLLIMWFGLGLQPKIVLVALASFLLLFFSTFAGAQAVDRDMIETLELMGASARERFQKAVLPGCTTWIMGGLRNALPYALIGATVGEMMLARGGLGFLITNAAGQFDMTGIYAALFVLMILGIIVNEVANRLENWLLRWRPATAT
jgi:NitT/TauT family transport system permease protein